MTEIHAGYRVPSEELDEIPMDNYKPRVQKSRPSGECQRRLDAESYWSFVIRHRLAVAMTALFIAIVIAFIGIATYLAMTPASNYSVEINKITEVEYPVTEKVTIDELPGLIGTQSPSFYLEDESYDDMFDTLIRDTYKIIPAEEAGRVNRFRREIEEESVESCRKRHENCKVLLNKVKNITRNVSQQVEELQKMINRLGIRNEQLPSLKNVTALDFATCLRCERLENETANLYIGEISSNSDSILTNSSTPSQIENTQNYTDSKTDGTFLQNNEEAVTVANKTGSVIVAEASNESMETALPPNITYSGKIVNITQKIPDGSGTVSKNVTVTPTSVSEDSDYPRDRNSSSLVKDGTAISGNSADSTNNYEMNDQSQNNEAAVNEVDDAQANDGTDDFFFHHSRFNGNYGSKFAQVEPVDVAEAVSTTTEDEVAVLSTSNPENNDQSITPSSSVDQNYSPQGKANMELNPMIIPTAETSKGSLQVTYTPSISWMPYPLCIYGPPNPSAHNQLVRQKSSESITFPVSSPASSASASSSSSSSSSSFSSQAQQIQHGQPLASPTSNGQTFSYNLNFVQPIVQPPQQGVQFLPTQFQPPSVPVLPQRFGPTGPGTQYFPVNQVNHQSTPTAQGRPIYCSYLPTPTFQFPMVPGVSEFQRNVPESGTDIDSNYKDIEKLDNVYEQQLEPRDYTAGCPPNTRICNDRSQCVPKSRWCDGSVDCSDASDETRCSCRDRIDRDRLCDGYFDCPLGEDELGCFGCDKHSFSCDDSETRRRWGNCVPLIQRCDGTPQCASGKDELNCNIITQSVEEREMFTVGYTKGYLHRNWKGRWYPACTPSKTWANDACRAEIGDENYRDFPVVETVPIQRDYNGPYVVQLSPREIEIVESCSGNAIFVNCAKMPCGTRVSSQQHDSSDEDLFFDHYPSKGFHQVMSDVLDNFRSDKEKSKDEEAGGNSTFDSLRTSVDGKTLDSTNTTDGSDPILTESRVVGGRPSQPRAWPSLVAINRDGNFHCGGVILDEMWILTAAHCIDGYRKHYYDIQSGILRRFSYSPMEQSRKISHIVMYPAYDKAVMKNDIALLRLEKPLNFNRWVRPACLPEIMTAGPSWRTGPKAASTCVSAGWGSTFEHGPDPDHLREVELPILPNCKYLVDQNEAEICAGPLQGGRDTCQGDSGGPLMCRNPNSPSQWYVAGIVSHGEGCARPNEPGAYTKVSRFVDWINEIRISRELPMKRPLQRCPGYYCHSGSYRCYPSKRRCDKSVDCMDAEDEINCHRFTDFSLFRSANSENGDSFQSKPEDDQSSDLAKGINESTTSASSEKPSSIAEYSSTSMEVTVIQSTTTPTTEKIDQNSIKTNQVDILTTVTTPTITEREQQSTIMEDDQISTTVRTNQEISIPPVLPPQHFSCRLLIQTIQLDKRCDRIIDCEDGTDEEDCTCKDYLAKVSPDSICDGHIDCHDGTDEENCEICSPDEFHCKRSRECVSMDKRCDIKGDCQFNEDELGCLTLTNGKYVIIDIDGMPHHNVEGILTSYENGKWVPFCIDRRQSRPATLGKQMCSYFGFVGCESFNETRVENTPLEVRASSAKNLIPYEYSPKYSAATEEEPRCTALYLRCLPTIHTVPLAYRVKAIPGHDEDTFLWPWHAAVFVDGRYRCGAVLLEPSWLLTSIYCTENVDLNENYTTALLGVSRSYLQVDGPHQQMSQVDEIKTVKNSDAVLLHLKYPVNMTRHVQPMYLQKRTHAPAESDTCATVGVDKEGRTRTVFLKAVIHNCPDNRRCYKTVKSEKCENDTMTPISGTVVCFGCSGWYPAAVYHEDAGLCSFSKKQSLSSIDYINANLITGMQEPPTPLSSQEPKCNGFRCPLGKCIELKNVCDGVSHCRDGADEDTDYCREVQDHCENGVQDKADCHCAQSELRCANGQCVTKSAFCDGKIDCSDESDEPVNCNCAAYLKLTTPERICDGRRHCFDKSDESPDLCYCKDASFKCNQIGDVCVPQDFVCDGQPDCPSGQDEEHCQTLMSLPSDPPGYGEVIKRSYGVWHSRCFPKAGALPENKLAENLCVNFGYSYAKNFTESDIGGRGNSPVVPKLDKFHMVRLNPRSWIVLRDDKAFVSLHPPTETCYRNYVTCA